MIKDYIGNVDDNCNDKFRGRLCNGIALRLLKYVILVIDATQPVFYNFYCGLSAPAVGIGTGRSLSYQPDPDWGWPEDVVSIIVQ